MKISHKLLCFFLFIITIIAYTTSPDVLLQIVSYRPIVEGYRLLQIYLKSHIILCLLPALFLAGAIPVFIRRDIILKYLATRANKFLSYSIAAVSGSVLSVCSCTILPLFGSIYKRGAGIGPATALLYSGPAINVLAIVMTARILGLKLGVARAIFAILFSVIIGVIMSVIFKDDKEVAPLVIPDDNRDVPRYRVFTIFSILIGLLFSINCCNVDFTGGRCFACFYSENQTYPVLSFILNSKWTIPFILYCILNSLFIIWFDVKKKYVIVSILITIITLIISPYAIISFAVATLGIAYTMFRSKGVVKEWGGEVWEYGIKLFPLLLLGIFITGLLLGNSDFGPEYEGIIPAHYIVSLVGGNSISANFFAAIIGAFMYFATLTEISILQKLIASGMGKGPALALLLAGPALSLPNMLVLRTLLGTKKTVVYIVIVVIMSTFAGIFYGAI
jgi:uncharacterized membrane protein YraQ (UPF0718 family)